MLPRVHGGLKAPGWQACADEGVVLYKSGAFRWKTGRKVAK